MWEADRMSWPVIIYIAAPIVALLLLVASAWRVWRRFRSLLADVRTTSDQAAIAAGEASALLDRLPDEPLAPMGAGSADRV
jgi:hypothetical protein